MILGSTTPSTSAVTGNHTAAVVCAEHRKTMVITLDYHRPLKTFVIMYLNPHIYSPMIPTPNLFLKFGTAALCLWGTKLDAVTIIGTRRAVCALDVWHRSWNSATLISLHFSTLLFPFKLTEKHGIMVSGPTSRRYSIASSSCKLKRQQVIL